MNAGQPPAAAAAKWPVYALAGTILSGAFLLFQVQPLVSKAILPQFGGCPAVWTVCLLFFQTLLFAGYLYAHLVQRWLSPRRQAAVQVALAAAALAIVPLGPLRGWQPLGPTGPTGQILLLLTITVGLPYLVLAATSPLVQVWFSRRHPGRTPYRLYALSNAASLAALLSYPFVFEPAFELDMQWTLWSAGFVFYAACCVLCLIAMWRFRGKAEGGGRRAESDDCKLQIGDGPPLRHRVLWLLLPACASLLLLATTNRVCQDVCAVPLLWVVPLSLYLLSFILCFDGEHWYSRRFWGAVAVVAIVAVAAYPHFGWFGRLLALKEELVLYFSALFAACMLCHGELVLLRPGPRHLTQFYLLVAAGGATGGVLVNLVAPAIFTSFFEWRISLIVCFLLASFVALRGISGNKRWWLRLGLLPVGLAGSWCIAQWQAERNTPIERVRNFYGVLSVWGALHGNDLANRSLVLLNGTTKHGEQFVTTEKSRIATTYYSDESGVGQAIRYFRNRGRVRVGAVGLGVGTLATYAQPGDVYRFYEINPQVERIARTYFTFLADCRGKCEVIAGDARLSLQAEPPQHYDVLALDAFSSDAIPTHLLTREAFAVCRRHLAPGGVIAVHISNRYLDLAPVVRGPAQLYGLKTVRIYNEPDSRRLVGEAEWVLVTDNADFLERVTATAPDYDGSVLVWTDHYTSLFQILRRGDIDIKAVGAAR